MNNTLGTIIGFTYKNKVKTKSFLITTLVLAILMTIGMNLPYLIKQFKGGDDGKAVQIGLLYGNQQATAATLEKYAADSGNKDYAFVKYEGSAEDQLNQDVKNGKLEGYLKFEEDPADKSFPKVVYAGKGEMGKGLSVYLQSSLQNIKTAMIAKDSLTAEQIGALNKPVSLTSLDISDDVKANKTGDAEKDKNQKVMNYIIVYFLMILFFSSNMMTGNMIAAEVTAEKSSRIMEILITSVSPLNQMFGKIIGIFLVGITQMVAFGVVIAANVMMPQNVGILEEFHLSLADINFSVLVYGLLFYIFGYFLYAVLYAAVGSLVSRTEELGQAVMPITMIGLATFYIGIFSINTPGSMLIKITSFIPFTAPTSMLIRVGMGEVPVWQILISLALLIVSILVFGWLSAKIYRTGVLMYGKRPSFKELRKAMKAYKI
ncbi:ABC transporter permease [Paenibacillus sp.]|jgi:ABC-2 type transport system permease protein|uniref:ABC transporter permease n=1 Tax=Paenibacillus sp. TaxID=58172 RepID=UPI0028291CDB|nr:ABC transporter permease [Paenibacillus sp.]MDR0271434.1 ABC transporter permease [Paenibacillus sp.]